MHRKDIKHENKVLKLFSKNYFSVKKTSPNMIEILFHGIWLKDTLMYERKMRLIQACTY